MRRLIDTTQNSQKVPLLTHIFDLSIARTVFTSSTESDVRLRIRDSIAITLVLELRTSGSQCS